jgi:hypothetical protein
VLFRSLSSGLVPAARLTGVDGSGLVTLNASNLSSGTVAAARLSGAYTGITGLGTLTGLTSSGRIYSQEWIEFQNSTGLYSATNGAHFRPNPGSYGAWQVLGSRNTWGGIEFGDIGGGAISLMVNNGAGWGSQTTGMHNNAQGWLWSFSHQTLNANGITSLGGVLTMGNFQTTSTTSGYQYLMWGTTFGNVARFTSRRDTKESIQDLSGSGAIVDALRPVTFIPAAAEEEEEPETEALRLQDLQYGFIADEMAEVATGTLATWEPHEDTIRPVAWKWPDLIAVLTAEVKSLRARVAALEPTP